MPRAFMFTLFFCLHADNDHIMIHEDHAAARGGSIAPSFTLLCV